MEIKIKSKSAKFNDRWAYFNVTEDQYNKLKAFADYNFFISTNVEDKHPDNRYFCIDGMGFEDALLFVYRRHYNFYYSDFEFFKSWFNNPDHNAVPTVIAHRNPETGLYE